MGQPKAPKFEHAEIRVKDLSQAIDFYTNVIGLTEIARENGVVYLGCGLDKNYDLAIKEGGTGLEHFSIRVNDEDELKKLELQLKDHGVKVENTDGHEPGQEKGIRFAMPNEVIMEFVIVEDKRYLNPARPEYPRTRGIAPLNADHINIMTTNVKRDADFLQKVLGFRFSDIVEPEPGSGYWTAAWTRYGEYHHDIALTLTKNKSETLHHCAFSLSNFEDFKRAADILADYGILMELGPSRHPIGPNLYAYFWEPGGNRLELSAEAAIIDDQTPPNFWTGMDQTLDAWRKVTPPESFLRGS